jgi:hypothetical protein
MEKDDEAGERRAAGDQAGLPGGANARPVTTWEDRVVMELVRVCIASWETLIFAHVGQSVRAPPHPPPLTLSPFCPDNPSHAPPS